MTCKNVVTICFLGVLFAFSTQTSAQERSRTLNFGEKEVPNYGGRERPAGPPEKIGPQEKNNNSGGNRGEQGQQQTKPEAVKTQPQIQPQSQAVQPQRQAQAQGQAPPTRTPATASDSIKELEKAVKAAQKDVDDAKGAVEFDKHVGPTSARDYALSRDKVFLKMAEEKLKEARNNKRSEESRQRREQARLQIAPKLP